MDFTGRYELVSQENFEPFMKAMGVPDDQIQKVKDVKSFTEFVQNGNHFIATATMGSNVLHNEFTVGEEAELETLTGEKFKTIVRLEGNKLIGNLNEVISINELNGDTLTSTLTLKGIVYKRVLKKV
uniref:Liver-type fatty acid-binding protein n=1 Tax=Leptobrachium leishanense TaxID=445787 RepID=A0A8C5MBL4_9ANUR